MKSLTMYNPNAIQKVLRDFNRYYDSFFGDLIRSPEERILYYSPAVDIQENKNNYVMKMELPGFNEKNIEVDVNGVYLNIVSKPERKKERKGKEDKKHTVREKKGAAFSRSLQLPADADPKKVSAVFKDGILSLTIKKRGESQRRMIQINAA